MTVDVQTEILIDVPLEHVSVYIMDPDNAPDWYVNIKSVEWVSEPPVTLGSKMAFVATFMGKRLAYTYEVIELKPGSSMVMSTTQGPFPMETTYQLAAIADNQTQVRLRNRGKPKGFSVLMAPLMVGAMKKANRADLANLKRILESKPI